MHRHMIGYHKSRPRHNKIFPFTTYVSYDTYNTIMDTKTINLRDLPEELVRRAKACAALHGLTLKGFVMQALAEAVEKDIPAVPSSAALLGTSYRKRRTRKRKKKK